MRNYNSTHQIVVGIALAAIFGVGVSVFTVRAKHESEVARNAPTPAPATSSDQNAADPNAPTPGSAAQAATDQTAAASSTPPTDPSVAAPTPVAPTAPIAGNVAKDAVGSPNKSKASDRADRIAGKRHNSDDTAGTRVASAANAGTGAADQGASNSSDSVKNNTQMALAPSATDTTSSAPAGATADTQQAPAQTGQKAATSTDSAAASVEPVASDSQITSHVKSEIATAAPNSNVDVTTSNGVVALAGSVPNQAAVDQATQAAQRVPGVKQVDASALMVSNQ